MGVTKNLNTMASEAPSPCMVTMTVMIKGSDQADYGPTPGVKLVKTTFSVQ